MSCRGLLLCVLLSVLGACNVSVAQEDAATQLKLHVKALKAEDARDRLAAAAALGKIGAAAEPAIPALLDRLQDADADLQEEAARALALIGTDLQDIGVVGAVNTLRKARDALATHQEPDVREHAAALRRAVEYLELQQRSYPGDTIVDWIQRHPYIIATAALISLYLPGGVMLISLLLVRPTAILRMNDTLRALEFTLPPALGGMKIPLRHMLLVGFVNYRPSVLDAWIEHHADVARENFRRKRTVDERSVHVPVPVELDGQIIPALRGSDLQRIFGTRGTGRLLIWGEGGTGKTSLACQIALWGFGHAPETRLTPHRMLPVLIERELDFEMADGKNAFTETVRSDLAKLIGAPVSEDLLEALLEQRRVLVIVDHISEMTEVTRQRVRPDVPNSPAAALIVTSRFEEQLGDVPRSSLKPMRVAGDYVSVFMDAYLQMTGARELLMDVEFLQAGLRIVELLGDRPVTVLFIKLYLDRLIETKRRQGDLDIEMPRNVPSLALAYLNNINSSIPGNLSRDSRAVHQDAGAVAWACLKERFLPAAASIDRAVGPALASVDPENVYERLVYLERRLHLIETLEPERDRVRFLLDPVAEYLAGLHLVKTYQSDATKWREFLAQADTAPGGVEASRGFMLAVRDCCLARHEHIPLPEFLVGQLTRRAAVPALAELLRDKSADTRIMAADAFGQIGPLAQLAEPELIRALKDNDKFVRRKAAGTLGTMGSRVEGAIPALIQALQDEDPFVRRRAAEALGRIGPAAAGAVPALIEALQDESEICREKAAVALGQIGPATEGVIPALIIALKDDYPDVRWQAAVALGNIGPAAKKAVSALRTGLMDPMAGESMATALQAIEGRRALD